jgi:hypothetical protein
MTRAAKRKRPLVAPARRSDYAGAGAGGRRKGRAAGGEQPSGDGTSAGPSAATAKAPAGHVRTPSGHHSHSGAAVAAAKGQKRKLSSAPGGDAAAGAHKPGANKRARPSPTSRPPDSRTSAGRSQASGSGGASPSGRGADQRRGWRPMSIVDQQVSPPQLTCVAERGGSTPEPAATRPGISCSVWPLRRRRKRWGGSSRPMLDGVSHARPQRMPHRGRSVTP